MRMRSTLGTVAAALLLAPATAPAASDTLRAGAAAADITPPIGTPMFAFTSRSVAAGAHVNRPMQIVADPDHHLVAKSFVPSRGIQQRLKARAIVLEKGGQRYALVQADLGGVPYALTHEVAQRVAPTGIAEERILLSATHTHSATGPIWPADNGGYAALGGDLFDPRIFELTAQGVAEAILDAAGDLRPAKLGVGTVAVTDASNNRSIEPFRNNEDAPDDAHEQHPEAIDPELSVVRVDDKNNRPIGVWSNFAIHATSFGAGNLLLSGDNPGITAELVERELAKRAGGRDVVNVWTNGNEGDISPRGSADVVGGEPAQHVPGGGFGSAHMAGRRVADGILRAWRAAGDRMSSTPAVDARMTYLNFDGTEADGEPVGPVPVLGAGVTDDAPEQFKCAPFEGMAGPGQGRKGPGVVGAGLVPNVHPVSMWNVGGLGVVALPSEVTKQMGTRIRDALEQDAKGAYSRVALAGLTNSYVSYTATPEEYDTCFYEGAFTLFGRRQGARFRDVALGASRALLAGEPAPAGIAPPALGLGASQDLPARATPLAGSVLEQPKDVARLGRATLQWHGGDPAVDAPRGTEFVRVQRRVGNGWRTVLTDASFRNITERLGNDPYVELPSSPGEWDPADPTTPPTVNPPTVRNPAERREGEQYRETVQFSECDPVGTYRLVVNGRAEKGSGVEPYAITSQPFELARVKLTATQPAVSDGVATVKAHYPNPGAALFSLPRLVRTGEATFRVGGKTKTVEADRETGAFSVPVSAGQSVELVEVRDSCGNSTR